MKIFPILAILSFLLTGCASSAVSSIENLSGMNPVAMSPEKTAETLQGVYFDLFTEMKNHMEILEIQNVKAGLYIPNDYSQKKSYPLILLCAEVSSESASIAFNLDRVGGGIVFPGVLARKRQESFVLSIPDQPGLDDEVLLKFLTQSLENYRIDPERIYTFSAGGCSEWISQISRETPDLFAGSFYLQTDDTEINPDSESRFIIVSDGDPSSKWKNNYPNLDQISFSEFRPTLQNRQIWVTDPSLENEKEPLSFQSILRFQPDIEWLFSESSTAK